MKFEMLIQKMLSNAFQTTLTLFFTSMYYIYSYPPYPHTHTHTYTPPTPPPHPQKVFFYQSAKIFNRISVFAFE